MFSESNYSYVNGIITHNNVNQNFNYGHRSSVGLIPSLSLSVTQSNESLRFASSNESLRVSGAPNDLRVARSNESLKYANSNENIRKIFNQNSYDSTLLNEELNITTPFYNKMNYTFRPDSLKLLNQNMFPNMMDNRNLFTTESTPSPPLTYDMIESDVNKRFSNYSFNTQFMDSLNPPATKARNFSGSMGTINDLRYVDGESPPPLRSVGSFKDLKNGIINESIIDQKPVAAKQHFSKSQSVNLNGKLPIDNFINSYRNSHRASNSLNVNDLPMGGLSLEEDHGPQQHQTRRKSEGFIKKNDKKVEKDFFNQYKNVPFEQLAGQIIRLSTDQNGCRFLQKKLEERNPVVIKTIYKQIKPRIYDLVIDPFGNYLIQKIFEYISPDERTELIKLCSGKFDEISLNQHGTRALQKMIEHINRQEQADLIIQNLRKHVVRLIKDLNGNHVIQKCLYKFDSANCQFIIDGICTSIVEVATHRHGCCVLQKCLDRSNEEQFIKLGYEILSSGLVLMQDPFGNYVIQYLLPKKRHQLNPNFSEIIGKQIIGRLEELSIQKFASNVVEKCLDYLNDDELRSILVEEILNFKNLESVLKDPYGNYVVQTALDVAVGEQRIRAINKIGLLMPYVKNTPYARKIQQKLTDGILAMNLNPDHYPNQGLAINSF